MKSFIEHNSNGEKIIRIYTKYIREEIIEIHIIL